jgi:acetyl-CoA/propionyl-CoA carboxylase biotin carboxyl carrier protein
VKVIGAPVAYAGPAAPAAGGAAAGGRAKPSRGERKRAGAGGGGDTLASPLQGNVWKVLVEQGQTVEEGQLITIIEAMKMENEITAHKAGVIKELAVKEGDPIASGAPIAVITSDGASG